MSLSDGKGLAPITRDEACARMSKLVNRALGTRTNAAKIDKLFREHWLKLSIVAHQIHQAPESVIPPSTPFPTKGF